MSSVSDISRVLRAALGDRLAGQPTIHGNQVRLPIDPRHVHALASVLRERFAAELSLMVAEDRGPAPDRYRVHYVFAQPTDNWFVHATCVLGPDEQIVSLASFHYPASRFEREIFDLFGIRATGHPDPRRIYLEEDADFHPLRKDYPVQINMPVKISEPLQMTVEQFRSNIESDRYVRGGEAPQTPTRDETRVTRE